MSTVSLTSQIYSCAHPQVNGENADRMQSARIFDNALNIPSGVIKDANDAYSGRPSFHNAANGTNGLAGLGYAGLNPSSYMALETGLRQVEFQAHTPNTTFYDTIEGANRSNWYAQKVGASGGTCGLYNGPDAYTNTPSYSNCGGQPTTVDRKRYLDALYQEYRADNPYY